jgi:hypothetical protein
VGKNVVARQISGGTVPPKTWESLLKAVKTNRPGALAEIERIEKIARNPSPVFRGRGARCWRWNEMRSVSR